MNPVNIRKLNEYVLIKNLTCMCKTKDNSLVEVLLLKQLVTNCRLKYRMLMIKYSCKEIDLPPGTADMSVLNNILDELALTRPS